MNMSTDEDEHSIEMHLPYIQKIMSKYSHADDGSLNFNRKQEPFSIVPILVGAINTKIANQYANVFAPYLSNPRNLFVFSSDFCHWGRRFAYTFHVDQSIPIHASIEIMDRRGMELIEKGNIAQFNAYLKETKNTICGRHPILILLATLQLIQEMDKQKNVDIKFVHYSQSSHCKTYSDSSVSYASAYVSIE